MTTLHERAELNRRANNISAELIAIRRTHAEATAYIATQLTKVRKDALEEAAQFIEVASLGDEFGDNFSGKAGCAAILADGIRALATSEGE